MTWRECDDRVVRLIIVKVIVVVLDEENRCRAAQRGIEWRDLLTRRSFQKRFVCRAEHRKLRDEFPRVGDRFSGRSKDLRCSRRLQIPIHMIAVGDNGVRIEREAAHQELLANGGWQKAGLAIHRRQRIMATCARVYKHSKPVRSGVGCRKRSQRPGFGYCPAVGSHERQYVSRR